MNSIKQKILFGGGIALLIVSISLIAYAGSSAYSVAVENAKTAVEKNATEQAVLLKTQFEAPLADSRALANAFTGVRAAHGDISRDNAANMIQPIIAKNQNYLSGGTIWEPNAYTDAGDDARYAGKDGYESNGRMRVMMMRDSSGLVQRKMYDSTKSTEPGDYYYLTKERMKEVITEPATNPAIGRTEPFISFTAPIIVNGTFKGIVINDISTKTLKDLINKINLYDDQAIVLLLSDKGQIVAAQKKNEQWIGKNWKNANITFIDPSKVSAAEKAYHSGITTTTEGNGYVKSLVPFNIGDTGSYWAVIVAVPTSVITAQAFQTVMNLIIVGIIMSLMGIAILYTVARSISAPIVEVAEISKKMAHGDVDLEIEYTSHDEIGRLADSFRQMIENFKAKTEISTALSNGNLDVMVPIASDKDKLGHAMSQMKDVIDAMVETLQHVASAAESGQLQERGKADEFRGEYRKIISSLNATLDSVINPVTEVMRLSDSYAQGDYTERFNENISVAGDFIPFKDALNQIGISGSEAIGGVKDEIFALTAGMEETNATVEEVASTASTLAQSSSSVSVIAEKSGQGIKKTLDAMDELVSTMNAVSTKTEDVSAKAKQTVDLSQQGASLAGNAEKGMQAIMVSVSGTSEIISDITGQMDEIGKIVDVITAIAEQTGLLALNAAIEAARAGEAGMGFAVVADEVKTLALESQKSAENIASIIETLQKKSQQVTKSMDSSASEVKSGNQAVGETLAVFNQIVEAVNTVHTNMKEVAEATERQADFVREITTNVNEVGSLVQQTAKEAVDSAAATEEVAASIDQITRAISEAAAAVQRISDEMNKFITS